MKKSQWIAVMLSSAIALFPLAGTAQTINELVREATTASESYQHPEAEILWRQVLRRDPKSAAAYIGLGNSLRDQTKYEPAILAYQKAIEVAPQDPKTYFALGNMLILVDRYDQAIATFRKAVAIAPTNSEAYVQLGQALTVDKSGTAVIPPARYDEAIAAFRKAIALDPANVWAYLPLSFALERQGKAEQAIAILRQATEIKRPEAITAFGELRGVLKRQNRQADMIPIYQQAIQRPDLPQSVLYRQLGDVLQDLKRFGEAEVAYRQSLNVYPNNSYAHISLGDVLLDQDRTQEAIASYREAINAIARKKTTVNIGGVDYMIVGNELQGRGQLDLALIAYNKGIELEPAFAGNYTGIGKILKQQKQFKPAESILRQGIQVDRENSYTLVAYSLLGQVLREQGRFEEALTALQKSLQLAQKSNPYSVGELHNEIGLTLQQQGKFQEAIAAYRQALQSIAPENREQVFKNIETAERLERSRP